MNSENVIQAHNLTKKFGDFTAVNSINFEVKRGEIFGFLGPNGSGKTTTIRNMLGLLEPTAGDVTVLGISVTKDPAAIRPRVGYMSQRFSLYNDLTVLQNLNFYGKAYGLNNALLQERIDEALALAGLEGRQKTTTAELSGGWRQRLALSAAILHRPEIVFLDEPTAGVDPLSRRAFWDLLYQLVAQNITVFVTTHYMDEAEHCHRLAFIQRGSIIAYGSPAEIKERVMPGQVLEIEPSNPIKAIAVLKERARRLIPDLEEVELYGSLIHLIAPQAKKYQKPVTNLLRQADIEVLHTALIEPSLEDVFIASMRAEKTDSKPS